MTFRYWYTCLRYQVIILHNDVCTSCQSWNTPLNVASCENVQYCWFMTAIILFIHHMWKPSLGKNHIQVVQARLPTLLSQINGAILLLSNPVASLRQVALLRYQQGCFWYWYTLFSIHFLLNPPSQIDNKYFVTSSWELILEPKC